MTARFFALLTNIGAAKLANATALGTRLEITQMAVGDGGGTLPTPNPAQTQLVNEQRRAALNTLSIDPINTSQIIAEQVIPEAEGGWWIREIGLLDKDGDLVAIANCAETYKPLMQEGSGRTQTIRVILIVSSTASVTLKIDPSVVLATRQYVDKKTDDKAIEVKQYADALLTEHEKSRNHPDATLNAKGFAQYSNAMDSDSEKQAATSKAVNMVAKAGVMAMSDHVQTDNPHDQYLQIANLLSEIKAQGPVAVVQTLANLGLDDIVTDTTIRELIDAAFPIGIPLPYPLADVPVTTKGIVFFKMNGGSFNTAAYPKLAAKYPTGVLPDLRGEFIRGFDDGRGVRADQGLLGWQGQGMQSHNHGIANFEVRGVTGGPTSAWFTSGNGVATSNSGGDETRPRNIAFNYIVRAA
ncbi:TPA: phage tail protein [Yersinia enterocolitica]